MRYIVMKLMLKAMYMHATLVFELYLIYQILFSLRLTWVVSAT